MCGIVGYTGHKDSTKIVFDGLDRLEYRGYDSSGIAISLENNFFIHKSTGRVKELIEKYGKGVDAFVYGAIGHTRWASHGEVSNRNAHPHFSNKISIVHNGVIDNADELKVKLKAAGYTFSSDTDSEVIAHLIDHHYTFNPFEAMEEATAELKGTYGIAVLFADLPGVIGVAKNGSPLVIGFGDNKDYFVASDTNALIQHTNRFIYLEDGDIAILNRDCDIMLNHNRQVEDIDDADPFTDMGHYEHYMLKEIHEQPDAIRRCFSSRIGETSCKLNGFNLSGDQLASTTSVTLIGCGTSYHAGLVAREYIERWAGVACYVEQASEFATKYLLPDRSGLYLAISQSGETYDTIECIKELHKKGIAVYGVVNTVGSTIARLCGAGVYTHAGPEFSVASTKAFTTQLAALLMFANMLGRSKNLGLSEGHKFCHNLNLMPDLLKVFIGRTEIAQTLIQSTIGKCLAEAKYALFLGRGISYPIAMEGALKLKEIAYVPCEAYAGGEMKHGPIAMIEEGTPVVCLVPDDRHKQRMLTNIEEVKARGAKIITVGPPTDDIAKLSSYTWSTPSVPPQLTPFFMTVAVQVFAYLAARHLGLDIDRPRNLAKSVTIG
jgi:glucosamine--fructose-6-phosphate aminotransferase (isomerizing)